MMLLTYTHTHTYALTHMLTPMHREVTASL